MVPRERLELSHLAAKDFESFVSTIPPSRLNIGRTVGYEKICVMQWRVIKNSLDFRGRKICKFFF